jgi:phospholipid transport system transporter-binding protein
MDQKQITFTETGEVILSGALTFASAADIYRATYQRFSQARQPVTVNMKQVTKVDSAGLALLVEWLRQAHTAEYSIHFVNMPNQLRQLIRVSSLQPLFPG